MRQISFLIHHLVQKGLIFLLTCIIHYHGSFLDSQNRLYLSFSTLQGVFVLGLQTLKCCRVQQTSFAWQLKVIIHLFSQNTGCLSPIWTQVSVHNIYSNEDILTSFTTDISSFAKKEMKLKKVLEIHNNLVSAIVCKVNYMAKSDVSNLALLDAVGSPSYVFPWYRCISQKTR